jgi:glycosyltransferase involved in cell wall biosynthesis
MHGSESRAFVPAEDSFVTRWRSEGPHRLRENYSAFKELLDEATALARAGDYAYAASRCEIAGAQASYDHCGLFASRELEKIVAEIARAALGDAAVPRGSADGGRPRRILHVATYVQEVGGLSRMLWRWINEDREGIHSLALVRQRKALPRQIVEAVRRSGGRIHNLSQGPDSLLDLARRLRVAASGVDLVVLHIDTKDIVPLLAFSSVSSRPPIAYVDHADHLFWLSTSIADVVIGLRRSGTHLACARRGVEPRRSVLLPIPLGRIERSLSRQEAKRLLGFKKDCILLVSVAREVKFRSVDSVSYADAHLPFLKGRPDAILVVLGSGQRDDWASAQAQVGSRILSLPESPNTALYYQAADIYVDSFPFVSTTSLLEAGSHGTPLVSRFPFSEGAEILGADMPGLAGALVQTRSVACYNDALHALANQGAAREELGEATRRGIADVHWGNAWLEALERVYALAARIDTVRRCSDETDEPWFGSPDVFIPFIHSVSNDRDTLICSQLHLMPVARRARHALDLAMRRGLNFDRRFYLLKCWVPSRVLARLHY